MRKKKKSRDGRRGGLKGRNDGKKERKSENRIGTGLTDERVKADGG